MRDFRVVQKHADIPRIFKVDKGFFEQKLGPVPSLLVVAFIALLVTLPFHSSLNILYLKMTALFAVGVAYYTSLALRLSYIEFPEDGIRLCSRFRFRKFQLADIAYISDRRIPLTLQEREWLIKPFRGRPFVIRTSQFGDSEALESNLKSLAIDQIAYRIKEIPVEISTSKTAERIIFAVSCWIALLSAALLSDPSARITKWLLALGVPFLVVIQARRLFPRVVINREGVTRFDPFRMDMPFDHIIRVSFQNFQGSEVIVMTSHKGTIAVSENQLGIRYPLFRDLLIVRATKAVVWGETNPDHLRLCTLPGPLDQLHAKPLNPTTTNQDEETVRA